MIQIKRVYDQHSTTDGYRVLVDRLWPRGIAKDELHANLWLKEVAPSTELRKEFHDSGLDWHSFVHKYETELKGSSAEAFEQLKEIVHDHKTVTLLYASKDEEHNHAQILQKMLKK